MSSTTDQIKAKLDIVTVLGGYIKLEKAGSSFKARCPFHNEKTPSFFVSPDRGSYYCFGCQAKGDIFTFVEEFEGLDFSGALKVLAERAGVTLDNFRSDSFGEKSDKDVLFTLTEQATFYFEKNLSENKDALEYLKSRGVTDDTIKQFRIGYAPAEWRGVHDFLLSKGAEVSDMERAGLIKRKDSQSLGVGIGSSHYDTFRSRIMFPISDSSGRIVAFSGRIFPNDPSAPKYLNSPETLIFKKSEVLFGLDKAKKEIHHMGYSILVEGQMDLVMLHQSGFRNTVASSGTALTEQHLVRLQRLSNSLKMAFDGDSAGFSAIIKGASIALSLGMEVKVAAMPGGKDPADMALQDYDGLVKVMKDSPHIISFILNGVIKSTSDQRVMTRKVASEVLPFVVRLSSASEQNNFVREINQKTGITESALWEDLRKIKQVTANNRPSATQQGEKIVTERSDVILKKLMGILFWQREKNPPDILVEDLEKNIHEIVSPDALVHFTSSPALVFETESYYNNRDNLSSDISELLDNLKEEKLKKEFSDTMLLMHKAEMEKNTEESTRLFSLCQDISKKLNEMKNGNLKNEKSKTDIKK
jgi:DNA primase